jgi:hypothetical protein
MNDNEKQAYEMKPISVEELKANWIGDPPVGGFENYVANHGRPMFFRSVDAQATPAEAPRITPADIEENIACEHYFTGADVCRRVTDDMVSRFLSWKLPTDFAPDCGISFKRESDYDHPEFGRTKYAPTGTNLLHAGQARAMLEHILRPHPEHESLRLLTFCVLVLRNGFTVTGESACVSAENFDDAIGRKIARENAIAKVWPLMGYELKSKLFYEAEYRRTSIERVKNEGSK